MLTIYSSQISERLKYALSIIFDDRKIEWQLTNDKAVWRKSSAPKLNYSNEKLSGEPFIRPSGLLFEDTIEPKQIDKGSWNETEMIQIKGVIDPISSIFYIVSLYDDYIQIDRDEHNRNIGKKSTLYRFDWLDKLIVERWIECVIDFIETENNVDLKAQVIPFKIIPTFDIDHAYAYKLREKWRRNLSVGKDILQNDVERIRERKAVLAGEEKDPFDTFDKIRDIAAKGFDVNIFWLLGDYSRYDKNINYRNNEQQELIRSMDTIATVGLHPSYQSNQSELRLEREKQRLVDILEKDTFPTRQHFLRVELPKTFQRLQEVGFTDDYSLAYADAVGFRAGLARPFRWFDLTQNKVSKLKLHPISYMDGTLNEYMELSIDNAIKIVLSLREEVKKYGGEFIPLWHNETIGDYGIWKGWSQVLEASLQIDE